MFARTFALVWALISESRAQADGPMASELDLTWQAAPGCPDRSWAQRALRDRLGHEVPEGSGARLKAHAELLRAASGFSLRLVTEQNGQQGERTLSAGRCEDLAQAAVLVIALALSDLEGRAPAPPDAESSQEPASPPPAALVESDALAPTGSAPTPERPLSLRAAVMMDAGQLPAAAFGPEATLSFAKRWFRAELAGFWLPARASRPREDGRVSVSLWALRPAGCGRLLDAVLAVDLCAGLELGRASGQGSGLSDDRQRNWFYRSAWSSLQFSMQLTRHWVISLSPGISVPLGRPSFVSLAANDGASDRTELHTPAVVSARAALGIGHTF